MKNLRTTLLCACMLVCSVYSFSQTGTARVNEPNMNKPMLFTSLPDKININPESFFTQLTSQGNDVSVNIGDKMPFQGKVVSASLGSESDVSSVVVRSANFPGARLIFSKAVIEGKTMYSGRIISMDHGDLYELQTTDGQYVFVKKKFYDLINE